MPREHEFWPGQNTKADRQAARRHINLEDVGVTPSTLDRYLTAVSRLAPFLTSVNSEGDLDEEIANWIQSEFTEGTPLHLVGDALSGLHHLEPFTRRKSQNLGSCTMYGGSLRFPSVHLPSLRTVCSGWQDGALPMMNW